MKKIVIILIFMLALNIHNVNAIESPFFISDVVIGGRTEDDYPDNGFSDTEIDEVSGDSEESDVSNYRTNDFNNHKRSLINNYIYTMDK